MLNLKPDKQSIYGIIQGKLTIHWVNICDMEAGKLKAYGTVGQDITKVLSFYIQKLTDLLSDFLLK